LDLRVAQWIAETPMCRLQFPARSRAASPQRRRFMPPRPGVVLLLQLNYALNPWAAFRTKKAS
jgi:hypothetical protein